MKIYNDYHYLIFFTLKTALLFLANGGLLLESV